MKYVLTVLATLAVLAIGALLFPYTGIYNVAATAGHTGLMRWFLSTTTDHSIKARADDGAVPVDLEDSGRVERGARAYGEICQTCHGAPGHERSVIGEGMVPKPPKLSEAAEEWSAQELHWVAEHGIKLAGMPAFGPTHSEEELWEIVAFLEQLPEMTPEQYATLTARNPAAADSAATGPADDGHNHVH